MKEDKISDLEERVEQLERDLQAQLDALTVLLPMAIAIPATTADSAMALKELAAALQTTEKMRPRSDDFWHLASAMALALSSRAVEQHPRDQEVVAIFQGFRAHRRQ